MILAEGPTAADLATLSQYGFLGIACVALAYFARIAYRRETDRADALAAEVSDLNRSFREDAIPALISAAAAIAESSRTVQELARMVRDLDREITARNRSGRGS